MKYTFLKALIERRQGMMQIYLEGDSTIAQEI